MNLKEQVIKANEAYRVGTPIISDAEYDILLSKCEDQMGMIEFEDFKQTLMEKSGEVTHDFVIGSLNKVKYGEGELVKWITKHNVKEIVVSEKLDGCSFVATYKSGKLVSGASRGDGTTGTDWTEKLEYIIPTELTHKKDVTVRGELVLCHGVPEKLGYKNARNGVVGIMNEDKIVPEKLKHVTALVYDILDWEGLMAYETFQIISNNFETPKFRLMKVDSNTEEELKALLANWKTQSNYMMDGLVLSTSTYQHENRYHPEKKIAFKVNSEGVATTVKGIEWNISKGGLLKPVVLVEPTEIDGTTVQRVTGFNYKYIVENYIGEGAIVSIIRSGEVIPKIINVIKPIANSFNKKHDVPNVCPSCGEVLSLKGVDLACTNQNCGTKQVKELASFLIKCGVEGVTETSLSNWGVVTFDDMLRFNPSNSKSQENFMYELSNKVFTKTKEDMFACMYFDGAGETNVNKLIDFYGKGHLETTTEALYIYKKLNDFPEGIGQKVVDKIEVDWKKNLLILSTIIHDKRWNPKAKAVVTGNLSGKTFLITGTLSKSRTVIENEIKANGGTIASSVSKSLNFLVCGSDAGSKLDKANKLGVKVINEDELKGMY